MLFSEIYGNYYNTIAAILDKAVDSPISPAEIRRIVDEMAFGESILTIPNELSVNGKWPLIDKDGRSILVKETHMPLTTLQKRWLKALLLDSRIRLFEPDMAGLEEVVPLFEPDTFIFYDQFSDGDPFEDERYICTFRTIIKALKNHQSIRILYKIKNDSEKWITCNPIRLEYSLRDDKFRLISSTKSKVKTINLVKVLACELAETFNAEELKVELHEKRTVELLLRDERQALERVMLQFSIYEKVTERLSDDTYKFILTYEAEDEIDILIRILSFGPNLKVIGPDSFVKQIKDRLLMQKSCGQ